MKRWRDSVGSMNPKEFKIFGACEFKTLVVSLTWVSFRIEHPIL